MNYNHRQRLMAADPYAGFTLPEIAAMRALSLQEAREMLATLRDIRALPSPDPMMPTAAERRWARSWDDYADGLGS